MKRAQYNSWRCYSRLRRRLLLALNTVPQPPQEEASIFHLATTRPPLRESSLTAHQLQQSGNQSPRSPTHSTIICALEKSVPFVLGYSSIQRPWEEASERTRPFYVRKAGQGLSTILQDIALSDSGSLFKAVYSSGVIQRGGHKQFSRRNHDERTRRWLPCSRQLGDALANPAHYG